MKRLTLTIALLAAFAAHAQDSTSSGTASSSSSSNPVVSNGSSTSTSGANVNGVSSASNPNNSAQQMIQLNTYNPDQVRSTSSSTSASTQTYSGTQRNINEGESTQNVRYSGTQTVKNVPGIAMSGPASGPCTGASGGLGVAGPGFGVGLNGSKVDDGCTVRENTRVLGQLFQALDASNPLKADAQAALIEGMSILRNMNAKIGGSYAPAQPQQVAGTPVMMPVTPSDCAGYTGNDPVVRQRMCGK